MVFSPWRWSGGALRTGVGVPSRGGEAETGPRASLALSSERWHRPSFSGGTEVAFTAYSKDGPYQRVAEPTSPSKRTGSLPWSLPPFPRSDLVCFRFCREDFDVDCYAQRRLSGGSHSYGGESPRLSPCSSIGKLSKSDEQLSSLDRDSGRCSRNTSCETLGELPASRPPLLAHRLSGAVLGSDSDASHWLC